MNPDSRRNRMGLVRLWWMAVIRPRRAFEEAATKPAPGWAFRVVIGFNIFISLTTNLGRVLGHQVPLLASWLTFLPTERYLLAQIFFLPVLRTGLWLLGAAIIHLGIRLCGKPSDYDRILTIGGIQYLVVVTYSLVVDWTMLALGAFDISVIGYIHGGVDVVWSTVLQVIGLRTLLGLSTGLALGLSLASTAFTLPFLALFAR